MAQRGKPKQDIFPTAVVLAVLLVAVVAVLLMSRVVPEGKQLIGYSIDLTDLPYAYPEDFFFGDTILSTHVAPYAAGNFLVDVYVTAPEVQHFFVYKTAYYSEGNAWVPFTLEKDSSIPQVGGWAADWISGSARARISSLLDANYQTPGFVIAYVCREYNKTELNTSEVRTRIGEAAHTILIDSFGSDEYQYFCGVKGIGTGGVDHRYWLLTDFISPTACENECTIGNRTCINDTHYELCSDSFPGPCDNNWGPATKCDPGTYCDEGICLETPECVDDEDCSLPPGYDDECASPYCNNTTCDVQVGAINSDNSCTDASGNTGVCKDGACCIPDCSGKECGPDSCGGTCPPGCSDGATCNANGQCEGGCTPSTEVCDGIDNDCDGLIDEGYLCPSPQQCIDGTCQCLYGSCDGSGTSCGPGTVDCYPFGTPGDPQCEFVVSCSNGCWVIPDRSYICEEGETCSGGQCVGGTTCGDGTCDSGEDCQNCVIDCGCDPGETCNAGVCEPEGCPSDQCEDQGNCYPEYTLRTISGVQKMCIVATYPEWHACDNDDVVCWIHNNRPGEASMDCYKSASYYFDNYPTPPDEICVDEIDNDCDGLADGYDTGDCPHYMNCDTDFSCASFTEDWSNTADCGGGTDEYCVYNNICVPEGINHVSRNDDRQLCHDGKFYYCSVTSKDDTVPETNWKCVYDHAYKFIES